MTELLWGMAGILLGLVLVLPFEFRLLTRRNTMMPKHWYFVWEWLRPGSKWVRR